MSGSDVTVIHGGWIVGFDGEKHRIIRDGVVVVRGDVIEHVGKEWRGEETNEIDARRDLVIPGLINMHCHVGAHAGDRMVFNIHATDSRVMIMADPLAAALEGQPSSGQRR